MSYCRFSEDSEVYVWTSGTHITVQVGSNNSGVKRSIKEFKVGKEKKVIKYLNKLREKSIKIPEKVFDRLRDELP